MRRLGLEVEARRWLWGNLLVFAPLVVTLVVVDGVARGVVPRAPALIWGGLLAAWAAPGALLVLWGIVFALCAAARVVLDGALLRARGAQSWAAAGWLAALLVCLAVGDFLTVASPQAVDGWLLGVSAVVGLLLVGRFYLLLLVSVLAPAWASRSAGSPAGGRPFS